MSTTMPEPNDRSAPKWDGDHRTLIRFLDTYKRVAIEEAKLSEYAAIRAIISYIPSYLRSDIENYVEYSPPNQKGNWGEFRTRLLKDYPRAQEQGGYTRQEFYEWASRHVNRSLRTEDELESFVREIRRLTTQLIAKAHLSAGEAGAVFEEAMRRNFGETFRTELYRAKGRLQTYTIDEVFDVAKDVVKMERGGRFLSPELATAIGGQPPVTTYGGVTYGSSGPAFLTPTAPVAMTVAPLAPQVKAEETSAVLMQQLLSAIQNLSNMNNNAQNGNQSTARPAYQPRFNNAATGDIRCYYCGDKHMMYNCPTAKADLAAGRVIKNGDNMYVYPNGDRIVGPREISIATKVDAWNKMNGGPQSASAMLVGVKTSEAPYITEGSASSKVIPSFESAEAEAAWHELMTREVFAYQQRKEVEGAPKRTGLRSQAKEANKTAAPERDLPPHQGATELAKDDTSRSAGAAANEPKSTPARTEIRRQYPSATIEEVPDEDEPKKKDETTRPEAAKRAIDALVPAMAARPQFRIQKSLDVDGLGKTIGDRILETKVVLSVGELIALCPSVKRYWKEHVAGKRVNLEEGAEALLTGVAGAAHVFRYRVLEEEKGSRDLISAAHILPLRYLDCRIGDIEAEGVLDGGAQIVILSQRLWEAIGKPIDRRKIMKLEAANNTNSETYGLCANLEVCVGGITLLLQAQVVEDAPFDLLLGRPFLAVGCTEEKTLADGRSHITIHDPNSELAVTLPTKERQLEPKTLPVDEQDF